VGHATAFTVNAALVVMRWQHYTCTVLLHPLTNADHEAEQAASTIFQAFESTAQISHNLST